MGVPHPQAADEVAPFLQFIFNQSIASGQVPKEWKHVTPVFKKGCRKESCNYWPVSLTSVSCKIMEHIVFHHIMGHLDTHHVLVDYQHGFRRGHSCETQLITVIEQLARNLDSSMQTDLLLLDFSKAFDAVPRKRLLMKLEHYGIRGCLAKWIESWLVGKSQSVVVIGTYSSQAMVKSGVPQGTVLGPLMFLLYINDIGNEINSNLRLFADDSILYGIVNNFQDAQALQADLNKLVEWAQKWQMTFNSSKCVMLRVSRSVNDVDFSYEMMGRLLESVESHKYLGVEIDRKLSWNKHISAITGKGNRALGFIRRNLHNCPEEVKKQAYYSLIRPHFEYASSAWDPHTQKNIKAIEGVQRRA